MSADLDAFSSDAVTVPGGATNCDDRHGQDATIEVAFPRKHMEPDPLLSPRVWDEPAVHVASSSGDAVSILFQRQNDDLSQGLVRRDQCQTSQAFYNHPINEQPCSVAMTRTEWASDLLPTPRVCDEPLVQVASSSHERGMAEAVHAAQVAVAAPASSADAAPELSALGLVSTESPETTSLCQDSRRPQVLPADTMLSDGLDTDHPDAPHRQTSAQMAESCLEQDGGPRKMPSAEVPEATPESTSLPDEEACGESAVVLAAEPAAAPETEAAAVATATTAPTPVLTNSTLASAVLASDVRAVPLASGVASSPRESTPQCPPKTADAGIPPLFPGPPDDAEHLQRNPGALPPSVTEEFPMSPLVGPQKETTRVLVDPVGIYPLLPFEEDMSKCFQSLPSVPDLPTPKTVTTMLRASPAPGASMVPQLGPDPSWKASRNGAVQPASLAGLMPIAEVKRLVKDFGSVPPLNPDLLASDGLFEVLPFVSSLDEEIEKPFVMESPQCIERREKQVRQQQRLRAPSPQDTGQVHRVKSPRRSALRKANSCSAMPASAVDGEPPRKRNVSIGNTDILEVAAIAEDAAKETKNVFVPYHEQVEERIFIRVARRPGNFPPLVTKNATGLTVAWGTEDEITMAQFSTMVTQAVEQLATQQRLDWEGPGDQCPGRMVGSDASSSHRHPSPRHAIFQTSHPAIRNGAAARRVAEHEGRCFTERKFLMQEGSFSILALTVQGEELDAYDEAVFNPRDGCRVVCHAEVRKYEAQSNVCCTLQ